MSTNEKKERFEESTERTTKIKYKWIIENINFPPSRRQFGKQMVSPVFPENDLLKWQLQFYPGGETELKKDYFSIYLELKSKNVIEVQTNWDISISNGVDSR